MCRGSGGCGAMLLLLSFLGIVNWLGCFDVVVMREEGVGGKKGWQRLARTTQAHFIFGLRGICAGDG